MYAVAVIGANYGDEGKGIMTDYFCRTDAARVVVRFNGGAQAGHTVVLPDGRRHVFSHFGSGTFAKARTYLSRFFVCNPVLYREEYYKLHAMGIIPVTHVHEDALVTTPFDMLINQFLEHKRGKERHGSCGVGFNETHERNLIAGFRLTVRDLQHPGELQDLLIRIARVYLPLRANHLKLGFELTESEALDFVTRFLEDCSFFRSTAIMGPPPEISISDTIIFEGAQGLLLDQHGDGFPHVTRSNTGLQNAVAVAEEMGVDCMDAIYVSRSYLTRHGAGPLPGESFKPPYAEGLEKETNVDGPWQGDLRYAPLDVAALNERVLNDWKRHKRPWVSEPMIAVTCCDQVPLNVAPENLGYRSYGPTHEDVRPVPLLDD